MKKQDKRLLMLAISFATCLTCGVVATGCGKDKNKNVIVLDTEIQATYEFTASTIELPTAHVETKKGDMVSYEVLYTLYMNGEKVEESEFSTFDLKVGDYKLVYSYENIKLEKSFSVVDTTAPSISFAGVLGSQFLQDFEDGYGTLPTPDITDLSEDEGLEPVYKLYFQGSDGVKKEHEFNEMTMSYQATEFGTFTFVVEAVDAYGNKSQKEMSWKIKDRAWQPSSTKEGYLADFDEEGYINYINKGTVDQWYVVSDITESYVEEHEGEKGAVKVSMGFNHAPSYGGYNTLAINLPKDSQFTREQGEGKYLAIRLFIEDDIDGNLSNNMIWGGNNLEISSDGNTKCSKYVQQGLKIGEWFTMYISATALDFYNKDTGKCEQVQICFSDASSLNGTNEHINFYIGGISLTDKLDAASGLKVEGNTASWNAVAGATGYIVENNGKKQVVKGTSCTVDGSKGYITVTPHVDGITKIDGDFAFASYGVDANEHLGLFNDEVYANFVDNATGHEYYAYCTAEKTLTEDGLKIKMTPNGVLGAYNGFRLHLAETLDGTQSEYLIVRMQFNNEKYKTFQITDANGNAISKVLSLEEKSGKFIDWKIDLSGYEGKTDALVFRFGPADSSGAVNDGLEVVLQDVKVATYLAQPEITDNREAKTISWNAVAGAKAYIISIDGKEQEVTGTSFNYADSKLGTFKIKAIGKSEKLVDSEFTEGYYFDVRKDNDALTGFSISGGKISWTNIAHNSGYEVKVNGESTKLTTNSYAVADGVDTVFVRAIGTDDYRDSLWVELKVIDGAVYEVKGEIELTSANIHWGTKGTIQLKNVNLPFEDGTNAAVYGNTTLAGESVRLNTYYFGGDNKIIQFNELGETTGKMLSIPAGTVIYANGIAYTVKKDFNLYDFTADQAGATWVVPESEFTIKKTQWGTTGIIQLKEVEIANFNVFSDGQTPLGILGEITVGNRQVSGATAKYYEKQILQFDGTFAEGELVTFHKGLMVYNFATKSASVLKEDFKVVFAGEKWNVYQGEVDLGSLSWGNNANLQIGNVAIDVDPDGLEGDVHTTSNLTYYGTISVNGTPISMGMKYFNELQVLMFTNGNFKVNDIVCFEKGMVIAQPSTQRAWISTANAYFKYNGGEGNNGGEGKAWDILTMEGEVTISSAASTSTATRIDINVSGLPNGEIDATFINVTSGGQKIAVTAEIKDNVLSISGEFGETFTLKAGSLIKLGEAYYVIGGEDVSLIYQGGIWGEIAGQFAITASGYATNTLAQLPGISLDFTKGNISVSGVKATMNGEAYTLADVYYHADASILQIHTKENHAKGDLLCIKAGSIFAKDGKFYELSADANFMLMEKDGSLAWSYVTTFEMGDIGYNTSALAQIKANLGIDAAKGEIFPDYTQVNYEASEGLTLTSFHYHANAQLIQPHFDGAKEGSTITFFKGSVFTYEGKYYVLTSDFTMTFKGSNWTK